MRILCMLSSSHVLFSAFTSRFFFVLLSRFYNLTIRLIRRRLSNFFQWLRRTRVGQVFVQVTRGDDRYREIRRLLFDFIIQDRLVVRVEVLSYR